MRYNAIDFKETYEDIKDNIGGGFRNGKHKNATKYILD